MAEIEFREARTLKVLSQMTEPARPSDIAKFLVIFRSTSAIA